MKQFGTSAFSTVVHWRAFGEVENECTSYNFRLFAIFLPKIIRIGGKLTKLGWKHFCVYTGIIGKDEWPPNSPHLNPLDYYVWGDMIEHYHTLQTKLKCINELKMHSSQSWMRCNRTQSTRQCWVSPRDDDHVLKLVVDTLNILCNKPLFCITELLFYYMSTVDKA